MRNKILLPATLLLFSATNCLLAAPAALSLALEEEAVVASGASAGGEVAWLGAGREATGSYQRLLLFREVTVADADGIARLELGRAPARVSVWAAVEVASGALAVLAVPEALAAVVALEPEALAFAADGQLGRLHQAHRWAELLLVRPGVGAWGLSAGDGGEHDADGAVDNQLTLELVRLSPLAAGGEPPAGLAAGDVLVVLAPERMQIATLTLPPGGKEHGS